MKRLAIIALMSVVGLSNATAQGNELAQLALNIEKLVQFKSILSDMKKGYDIVSKGYSSVKNLTEGNFSIHKVFLDGLMEVSPTVKRYHKVAGIIDYQLALVREYKAAFQQFRKTNVLNPDQITYLGRVYNNLPKSSLRNLDELAMVVTSGKLRMTEDERMAAIDQLFDEMEQKVFSLRDFNIKAGALASRRLKEKNDINGVKTIYGIKD
jgi:hypothetical protein